MSIKKWIQQISIRSSFKRVCMILPKELSEHEKNDFKKFMYENVKKSISRCFWPLSTCNNPAIQAHSIQNARVLDLLAKDQHVYMIKGRLELHSPQDSLQDSLLKIEFKKISRYKATTFTGLCSQHDNELFQPIDKNDFDKQSEEHCFLLAYRSVLRELYVKMDMVLTA